jgi:hypothetical protein
MDMLATEFHLPGVMAPALDRLRSTLEARVALSLLALRRKSTPQRNAAVTTFGVAEKQAVNINQPPSGSASGPRQASGIAFPRRIG